MRVLIGAVIFITAVLGIVSYLITDFFASNNLNRESAYYLTKAIFHFSQKDYKQSSRFINLSLDKSNNYFGHVLNGMNNVSLENYSLADKSYSAAIELNKNSVFAHKLRGINKLKLKDYIHAKQDLSLVLRSSKPEAELYTLKAHCNYKLFKQNTKNHKLLKEAISDWKQSAKLYKQDNNILKAQQTESLLNKIINDEKTAYTS